MSENSEVWYQYCTFAVVNRRGEILVYTGNSYCPTVEEPCGNTLGKIRPGYHRWTDVGNGCVGARIDYDAVHYNVNVEGKQDFITVRNYSGGLVLYNKSGRKDYLDLFEFPNNRVLPRGGVPLTLPKIIYNKEDEHVFDSVIVKPKEDAVEENKPLAIPRHNPVKKVVNKKDMVAEEVSEVAEENVMTNTLFDNFQVESFSTSVLMSLYILYYIAALAFLTEVGDAQTYYACMMILLSGQWGYVVHTMYEERREKFFQGGEKKIGETESVVDP